MLAGAKKEELKSTSLLDGMGIDIFESNFITLIKDITEEDIKAEFKHGILKLFVPKKEAKPAVEEKKYITIEG